MITNILDFYYHINGTKNNQGILDKYAANVNLLGRMKGEGIGNNFFVVVNYIVMRNVQIIYTRKIINLQANLFLCLHSFYHRFLPILACNHLKSYYKRWAKFVHPCRMLLGLVQCVFNSIYSTMTLSFSKNHHIWKYQTSDAKPNLKYAIPVHLCFSLCLVRHLLAPYCCNSI